MKHSNYLIKETFDSRVSFDTGKGTVTFKFPRWHILSYRELRFTLSCSHLLKDMGSGGPGKTASNTCFANVRNTWFRRIHRFNLNFPFLI